MRRAARGELRGPDRARRRGWRRTSCAPRRRSGAHDEATAAKRVADMKAVRAQMAPWSKLQGPTSRRGGWRPTMCSSRGRTPRRSRRRRRRRRRWTRSSGYLRASATQSSSGPAWDRTRREMLGESAARVREAEGGARAVREGPRGASKPGDRAARCGAGGEGGGGCGEGARALRGARGAVEGRRRGSAGARGGSRGGEVRPR